MREFLYVKDLARAVLFSIKNKMSDSLYNVGTGVVLSISELAFMVKEVVGFKGEIVWDSSKPDVTPRKLMDVSKLKKIGWNSEIDLEKGLNITYLWF